MAPDDLEEVLIRVAELAAHKALETRAGWLNIAGAAEYLSMTPKAVREAVVKAALPVHRTPTGRLRFRPVDLDKWITGTGVAA